LAAAKVILEALDPQAPPLYVLRHATVAEESARRVFDFLVDGELLRGSLGAVLMAKALSTEAVVELEYTFLALPPQPDASREQTDWCEIHTTICFPAVKD
jgi:hypothetical protein